MQGVFVLIQWCLPHERHVYYAFNSHKLDQDAEAASTTGRAGGLINVWLLFNKLVSYHQVSVTKTPSSSTLQCCHLKIHHTGLNESGRQKNDIRSSSKFCFPIPGRFSDSFTGWICEIKEFTKSHLLQHVDRIIHKKKCGCVCTQPCVGACFPELAVLISHCFTWGAETNLLLCEKWFYSQTSNWLTLKLKTTLNSTELMTVFFLTSTSDLSTSHFLVCLTTCPCSPGGHELVRDSRAVSLFFFFFLKRRKKCTVNINSLQAL